MSESRTSPFEGVISKTAAATAAGLLALTLAGKSEQNYAYAASAEPNEELAVDRDPLLERFDREILGITKEVKYLVKIDAPGTYKDKLTLPNGQKLDRLSVAVKNGRGGYTKSLYIWKKAKLSHQAWLLFLTRRGSGLGWGHSKMNRLIELELGCPTPVTTTTIY